MGAGLAEAKEITATAEDNIYADEIILARRHSLPDLVLTRFKDDLRLFSQQPSAIQLPRRIPLP